MALLPLLAGRLAAAEPPWDQVAWGERSDDIARHFGPTATRLSDPIRYGDSYVDVVLRDQRVGGYPFQLYFQMDKDTGRLKRVMFERQRHGANPMVWRAVVEEFQRIYGPPTEACEHKAAPGNGYQAASERIWREGGRVIRTVFRDTTMEASEGCLRVETHPCGLTGRLFIQIAPPEVEPDGCR